MTKGKKKKCKTKRHMLKKILSLCEKSDKIIDNYMVEIKEEVYGIR